ncbi:hypothetical protein JT358_13820 [Micrococcales bacterium 31B]|nr:hypothetical protein [Micrococcales bacterium 31B]
MPSTIARRGLAVAAVLMLLLTGCSSTNPGDAGGPATGASGQASGDAPSQPSGDSETSPTARPDQPIYYDRTANRGSGLKSDLEWHGGMVHSGATQMPNLSIAGWMPGLA